MFNIGMTELILVLIVSLMVFGPGKLPEIGKAVGKSLNEFRRAADSAKESMEALPPSTMEKEKN